MKTNTLQTAIIQLENTNDIIFSNVVQEATGGPFFI